MGQLRDPPMEWLLYYASRLYFCTQRRQNLVLDSLVVQFQSGSVSQRKKKIKNKTLARSFRFADYKVDSTQSLYQFGSLMTVVIFVLYVLICNGNFGRVPFSNE